MGLKMMLDTKLTCPSCGTEKPLRSFNPSEEILEVVRLAARFGRNWPWVEEYLHCFRPALDRPLRPTKMKILLEELLSFIEHPGFNIDKHWHQIRPNAIYEAIRYVAQTNKTGFKNHNYLKKVAIDMNLKMIQKEEKEQNDRAQEAMRRDPSTPQKIKDLIETL